MINLSELARKNPDYPLWWKIKYFVVPDIYFAENIRDLKENAHKIKIPWHKKSTMGRNLDHILIQMINLGLKTNCICSDGGKVSPPWFVIHDSTGQEVAYWQEDEHDDILGTPHTYQLAKEKQGLKDDDWTYEIYLRYFLKGNLSTILQVNKYKFSNPKKDSLLEKIKNYLPNSDLIPQPAQL
jgi:hypothetical protein